MDDRFKHITLSQMEALICLVEQRNFSRAAKQMLLTQPALTKTIRNIEELLSARIVNRSHDGISLTPEGKVLFDLAMRMVKLRADASERFQKLSVATGGDIRMAASTIPATYILPRALSELAGLHPDIRIFLKMEDSEEVMNMVLDKDVEIGCIGKAPLNRKLSAVPLWRDRLILVAPKGHRWARKRGVSVRDLMREPFVFREKGSATREVFEQVLKERFSLSAAQFNVRGELGSSEAVKEAVLAGLGVSVLSVHAVSREIEQKLLVEIPVERLHLARQFHLIYLKQFDLRPQHGIFIDFLKRFPVVGS